jgi:hypothetical protein
MTMFIGLFLAGCSDGGAGGQDRQKVYKVSGKITMAGGSVANALVSFSPKDKQPVATGRTGTDGRFTVTTYDAGDGAAAGEYVVLVVKDAGTAKAPTVMHGTNPNAFDGSAQHAASKAAAAPEASSSLPLKYSSVDQTDLHASVKADGPNEFNFELKP